MKRDLPTEVGHAAVAHLYCAAVGTWADAAMTTLAGYCDKYAALLEQGGKGDAAGAPQLELLHEIYQLLKTASPEEVKAAQPGLEKSLTTAVVQGPAQPVRRLVSSCFGYLYARGARQTLYTTVGTFMGWLNNKSSPLRNELAKQATCAVLGELSEMHGGAMVSLCHETINLMVKNLKGDLPLRAVSAAALTAARTLSLTLALAPTLTYGRSNPKPNPNPSPDPSPSPNPDPDPDSNPDLDLDPDP